jgi:subtilisin family serine protease
MRYIFLLFVTLSALTGRSQEYGWVMFTDKSGVSFDPFSYFDARAIERRIVHELSLYDPSDFPLNKNYVNEAGLLCDSVMGESRWFNMIFVKIKPENISLVTALPFVAGFVPYEFSTYAAFSHQQLETSSNNELQEEQVNVLGGPLFNAAGFDGKGIRIAVFDGGFPAVDKHASFKHLRDDNRILKTWDFTSNKEMVYAFQNHGTSVLSCITGMNEGKPMGLATGAEFLLARTEVVPEPFSEEKNWLMAAEWADKNGAHIINSSLGYTKDRYFPHQMDGKFTFVTRAANMAARKGILVINAAGNEGDKNSWKTIGAPADADSVLSIGGIDPDSRYHISFSSFGPTADKRVKPNVCAFGKALVASKSGIEVSYGTSFAAPLVTGFAACAMQSRPGIKNMELFREIEKSGTLYPYFDYAHGYGVPQAEYFLENEKMPKENEFECKIQDGEIVINVSKIYPEKDGKKNYLYFHFQNENGFIERYGVVEVYQEEALRLYSIGYYAGCSFRVHYHGNTYEMKIPKN